MLKKLFILGNGVDWCEKSLQGASKQSNVYIINKKIPITGKLNNKLSKIFFSYRINKIINFPFKTWMYRDVKRYIEKQIKKDEVFCVLIYDHNVFGGEKTFIDYLRKNFKNIKIAYIFTNIVKYTAASEKGYLDKLNNWYDVVFAFDKEDSKKYKFEYSPLIYDGEYVDEELINSNKEEVAFYVGQAKDRLNSLIEIYERLKMIGVKCKFYIVNVDESEQKYKDEIVYNKYITYEEAVSHIKNATCLIDSIQGGSTGLTIKNCEAICYNKKLITTNKHIKEYSFYDSKFINVIDNANDISEKFFNNGIEVKYVKEGKETFSFETFYNKLWLILEQNKVENNEKND